jgi:hypothetical protein
MAGMRWQSFGRMPVPFCPTGTFTPLLVRTLRRTGTGTSARPLLARMSFLVRPLLGRDNELQWLTGVRRNDDLSAAMGILHFEGSWSTVQLHRYYGAVSR